MLIEHIMQWLDLRRWIDPFVIHQHGLGLKDFRFTKMSLAHIMPVLLDHNPNASEIVATSEV